MRFWHVSSNLNFCSSWFQFPHIPVSFSISQIKSQNCSELRKGSHYQNTREKLSRNNTVRLREGIKIGCQRATWSPKVCCDAALFHLCQRKKAWLPQLGFGREGNLTPSFQTTLECSTIFSLMGSGSLGTRAVGNGDIPLYFTFVTLLRAMKLLSESQHLNIWMTWSF